MTETSYVTNMVLPGPQDFKQLKTSIATSNIESVKAVTQDGNTSAQINGDSICIFGSTLTAHNKDDVSNSTLLAQLAATKQYDPFKAPQDWYKMYLSVLGNVGWIVSESNSSTDNYDGATIDWENIVITSMEPITSQSWIQLAKTGMGAWQNLAVDGEGMLIWNNCTISGNYRIFQIIPVDKLTNGDLVMGVITISSSQTSRPDGFLSWSKEYSLERFAGKLELDEDVYSKNRQAIIDKLGDYINKLRANLPI